MGVIEKIPCTICVVATGVVGCCSRLSKKELAWRAREELLDLVPLRLLSMGTRLAYWNETAAGAYLAEAPSWCIRRHAARPLAYPQGREVSSPSYHVDCCDLINNLPLQNLI